MTWLDRCSWARAVIDLDAGPLEVQLATAMTERDAARARVVQVEGLLAGANHNFESLKIIADAARADAALRDIINVAYRGSAAAGLAREALAATDSTWLRERDLRIAERAWNLGYAAGVEPRLDYATTKATDLAALLSEER